MRIDDGSFLYQFSTCGVKYDLYSFRFEQQERVLRVFRVCAPAPSAVCMLALR